MSTLLTTAPPANLHEAISRAFQRLRVHFRESDEEKTRPFTPEWNTVHIQNVVNGIIEWISIPKIPRDQRIHSECNLITKMTRQAPIAKTHVVELILRTEKYALRMLKIGECEKQSEVAKIQGEEKPKLLCQITEPLPSKPRHEIEREEINEETLLLSRQILVGVVQLLIVEISTCAGFPLTEVTDTQIGMDTSSAAEQPKAPTTLLAA